MEYRERSERGSSSSSSTTSFIEKKATSPLGRSKVKGVSKEKHLGTFGVGEIEQSKKIEKLKGIDTWWKDKRKEFKPIIKPTFSYDRDETALEGLARSENPQARVRIKSGGLSSSNLVTGLIELSPKDLTTERFKKIVTLHEAAHLSISPFYKTLSEKDQVFFENNHMLINILEDVRVNRYLCLGNDGIGRYFKEELESCWNGVFEVIIGDLIKTESDKISYEDEMAKFLKTYQEEVRELITFDDVMALARKIHKDFDPCDVCANSTTKKKGKEGLEKELSSGESGEEECDGCGCSGPEDEDGSGAKEKIAKFLDGLAEGCETCKGDQKTLEEVLEDASMDPKLKRFLNKDSLILTNDEDNTIKISRVLKPKEYFLRNTPRNYRTVKLNKAAIEKLKKNIINRWKTKNGRLGKIDASKMITDSKIFHRKINGDDYPTIYMVLDCSGSMGESSLSWQTNLVMSVVDLCKQLGLNSRIFVHSGEKGTLHYSEIDRVDVPYVRAKSYNLDGSMLETLLTDEIKKSEKSIVFYFSDGGLPAEHSATEGEKIKKYLTFAKHRKIPIFGVGLGTPDVRIFDNWYQVRSVDQFNDAFIQMGRFMKRYIR